MLSSPRPRFLLVFATLFVLGLGLSSVASSAEEEAGEENGDGADEEAAQRITAKLSASGKWKVVCASSVS